MKKIGTFVFHIKSVCRLCFDDKVVLSFPLQSAKTSLDKGTISQRKENVKHSIDKRPYTLFLVKNEQTFF